MWEAATPSGRTRARRRTLTRDVSRASRSGRTQLRAGGAVAKGSRNATRVRSVASGAACGCTRARSTVACGTVAVARWSSAGATQQQSLPSQCGHAGASVSLGASCTGKACAACWAWASRSACAACAACAAALCAAGAVAAAPCTCSTPCSADPCHDAQGLNASGASSRIATRAVDNTAATRWRSERIFND